MAILTLSNVPDDVHRALCIRAAQNGHSTEAEVHAILCAAVKTRPHVRMGDALASLGTEIGLTAENLEILAQTKDRKPADPPVL